MAHTCYLSPHEAETGLPQVQSQPGLHSEAKVDYRLRPCLHKTKQLGMVAPTCNLSICQTETRGPGVEVSLPTQKDPGHKRVRERARTHIPFPPHDALCLILMQQKALGRHQADVSSTLLVFINCLIPGILLLQQSQAKTDVGIDCITKCVYLMLVNCILENNSRQDGLMGQDGFSG